MASCSVGLTLALLLDTSASINQTGWNAQVNHTADAIVSDTILNAIDRRQGIQVYVGAFDHTSYIMLNWVVIRTPNDARSFSDALRSTNRPGYGITLIARALEDAQRRIQEAPCESEETTIDVSTDGGDEDIELVHHQRDAAFRAGYRINGIGVASAQYPNPDIWIRDNMITPGGFALVASNWNDYALAIRRKLVLEITSN